MLQKSNPRSCENRLAFSQSVDLLGSGTMGTATPHRRSREAGKDRAPLLTRLLRSSSHSHLGGTGQATSLLRTAPGVLLSWSIALAWSSSRMRVARLCSVSAVFYQASLRYDSSPLALSLWESCGKFPTTQPSLVMGGLEDASLGELAKKGVDKPRERGAPGAPQRNANGCAGHPRGRFQSHPAFRKVSGECRDQQTMRAKVSSE